MGGHRASMKISNFDEIINKKHAHPGGFRPDPHPNNSRSNKRVRVIRLYDRGTEILQKHQILLYCSRRNSIRRYSAPSCVHRAPVSFMAQLSFVCTFLSRRLLTFALANQSPPQSARCIQQLPLTRKGHVGHREKNVQTSRAQRTKIPLKLQQRTAARKETSRKLPSFHGALS